MFMTYVIIFCFSLLKNFLLIKYGMDNEYAIWETSIFDPNDVSTHDDKTRLYYVRYTQLTASRSINYISILQATCKWI